MNQKGSANMVLIILVIILAAALGYVTLVKQQISNEQPQLNNLQNIQQIPQPVVNQNPLPAKPPVVEADINLIYPDGSEILSLDNSVNITYKVSNDFKSKISSTDKTELYLLDSQNILVGYIGKFDVNSTQFVWNPKQLLHNGGLDSTSAPTPSGQYRILVLVRPAFKPKCTDCAAGVDTLDNPYTKFENGYLINSEAVKSYGPSYKGDKPLASDFSASPFAIK